jgi:hypothetical protein
MPVERRVDDRDDGPIVAKEGVSAIAIDEEEIEDRSHTGSSDRKDGIVSGDARVELARGAVKVRLAGLYRTVC